MRLFIKQGCDNNRRPNPGLCTAMDKARRKADPDFDMVVEIGPVL
jgi:hypothetical protein